MTSSRPGARDIDIDAPRSNSRRSRSVSTNGARLSLIVDPSPRTKRLLQQRLDLRADVRVGVPRPRDLGLHVQRRIERPTARIGHDHAALFRDERAADVVRMARECRRQPAFGQDGTEKRTKIGDEAIVSCHELVQLTAGRGVLILEAVGLSRAVGTQCAVDDRLVDRGELVARAGKEANDRDIAVRDARCCRRSQPDRQPFAGQPVVALCICTTDPHRLTIGQTSHGAIPIDPLSCACRQQGGTAPGLSFRSPDPMCNPYLTFAAMLAAGLDGIKNKITPPESTDVNIYHLNAEERKKMGIEMLPGSLMEANMEFMKDKILTNTMGSHITENLNRIAQLESDAFRLTVHPWELERYLATY